MGGAVKAACSRRQRGHDGRQPERRRELLALALAHTVPAGSIASRGHLMITELSATDANEARQVRAGETIAIRLDEIPSTGYRWVLTCVPINAVVIVSNQWVANSPVIGGAGRREFLLRVERPGPVVINTQLLRTWQGEGSAINDHEFRIEAV
jgi:inhibitor of cysteine peptidase